MSRTKKIINVEEEKWYHATRWGRTICCDCGLAHDTNYKIVDNKIYFRTWRNKRSTAQVRRWIKK